METGYEHIPCLDYVGVMGCPFAFPSRLALLVSCFYCTIVIRKLTSVKWWLNSVEFSLIKAFPEFNICGIFIIVSPNASHAFEAQVGKIILDINSKSVSLEQRSCKVTSKWK